MNPQIEQAIERGDAFLAAYPTLCQYERLRDVEKKTGHPKVYFFFAIIFVITSALYGVGGMKLISDLAAFLYPAYASFKAIDTACILDDTQWLTYWVVFALFSIVESVASFLVEFIPFYHVLKISFFLWLYHPKFMGAGLMYTQIVKPMILPYLQISEVVKKTQKKEE